MERACVFFVLFSARPPSELSSAIALAVNAEVIWVRAAPQAMASPSHFSIRILSRVSSSGNSAGWDLVRCCFIWSVLSAPISGPLMHHSFSFRSTSHKQDRRTLPIYPTRCIAKAITWESTHTARICTTNHHTHLHIMRHALRTQLRAAPLTLQSIVVPAPT